MNLDSPFVDGIEDARNYQERASATLILIGFALVALSWLPGPLGVPRWFTLN